MTPVLKRHKIKHSGETLLALHKALLKPRMVEERMLLLLRQGKISKWFSGIGQEAVSVGSTVALRPDEFILPLHRNLGVFTTRGVPLAQLFKQFQGKGAGFTKGRDRSFHFGSPEHHIVGMISHLGPQLGVADGIALASLLEKKQNVTLVFCGDGATSEGDFHEAINVASVWDLPVIFLIENNQYGLSTPVIEQYRCERLCDRAIGYGIEGVQIDGNDVLEVYETVTFLANSIRKTPRPVILECLTFRMRGHEEASGTKYVPEELLKEWGKKDPVEQFEQYLRKKRLLKESQLQLLRKQIEDEISAALISS